MQCWVYSHCALQYFLGRQPQGQQPAGRNLQSYETWYTWRHNRLAFFTFLNLRHFNPLLVIVSFPCSSNCLPFPPELTPYSRGHLPSVLAQGKCSLPPRTSNNATSGGLSSDSKPWSHWPKSPVGKPRSWNQPSRVTLGSPTLNPDSQGPVLPTGSSALFSAPECKCPQGCFSDSSLSFYKFPHEALSIFPTPAVDFMLKSSKPAALVSSF